MLLEQVIIVPWALALDPEVLFSSFLSFFLLSDFNPTYDYCRTLSRS